MKSLRVTPADINISIENEKENKQVILPTPQKSLKVIDWTVSGIPNIIHKSSIFSQGQNPLSTLNKKYFIAFSPSVRKLLDDANAIVGKLLEAHRLKGGISHHQLTQGVKATTDSFNKWLEEYKNLIVGNRNELLHKRIVFSIDDENVYYNAHRRSLEIYEKALRWEQTGIVITKTWHILLITGIFVTSYLMTRSILNLQNLTENMEMQIYPQQKNQSCYDLVEDSLGMTALKSDCNDFSNFDTNSTALNSTLFSVCLMLCEEYHSSQGDTLDLGAALFCIALAYFASLLFNGVKCYISKGPTEREISNVKIHVPLGNEIVPYDPEQGEEQLHSKKDLKTLRNQARAWLDVDTHSEKLKISISSLIQSAHPIFNPNYTHDKLKGKLTGENKLKIHPEEQKEIAILIDNQESDLRKPLLN